MRVSVVDKIIKVLNNDKHIVLMEMKKRRRGNNRILVDIICEMIDSLVLLLSHYEPWMILLLEFSVYGNKVLI